MLTLTRDEARHIATIAQGLDRRPLTRRIRASDIMDVVDRLGCIQLDTISVISRSHETVLWSRLGTFDPQLVVDLYDPALQLTEYWAHAAAIVPMSILPLLRGHMEASRQRDTYFSDPANQPAIRSVMERLKEAGPIASRDFDAPTNAERASPWEWYGVKREREALAYLWTSGDIVVRKRERSFARIYDLPRRVVPELWSADPLSREYVQRALLTRAIRALGVVSAAWASDYFRSGKPVYLYVKDAKALLHGFEREGKVVRVQVRGIREDLWLDAARVETLALLREGKGRPTLTTFLSPFDNLVWNRDRDLKLFDFDYRLECYVPAPKRIWGYYTLPILHRGRLVGRMEPSYDRKMKVLTIKALYLEPWVKPTPPLAAAIVRAFKDLLGFLGGQPGDWRLFRCEPLAFMDLLMDAPAPYVDTVSGVRDGSAARDDDPETLRTKDATV